MSTTNENVATVPNGYTAVTPWIISPSTEKMITFLTAVFNAEEIPNSRITGDQGRVIHVVVKLGDAMIMLFDARDGWGPTPSFLKYLCKRCKESLSPGFETWRDVSD